MKGYGLIAVLVLVALASLAMSSASQVWLQASRRDKEQELLRIGQLYVQALKRYRDMSPGSDKRLPTDLQELLLDKRFLKTERHLRTLYPNPLVRDGQWALIRDDAGRITGVFCPSGDEPMASAGVKLEGLVLPPAQRYSDWKFMVNPKI